MVLLCTTWLCRSDDLSARQYELTPDTMYTQVLKKFYNICWHTVCIGMYRTRTGPYSILAHTGSTPVTTIHRHIMDLYKSNTRSNHGIVDMLSYWCKPRDIIIMKDEQRCYAKLYLIYPPLGIAKTFDCWLNPNAGFDFNFYNWDRFGACLSCYFP